MSDTVRELPRNLPERALPALLATARDGGLYLLEFDAARDSITWIAAGAAEFCGHPTARLKTGCDMAALLHPDDLLSLKLTAQRERRGGREVTLDCRVRDVHQRWRWVELRGQRQAARSHGADSGPWRVMVRDITARREADSRLALSGLMLELVHDAVLITQRDGVIAWANAGAARLFSAPLAALEGRLVNAFSAEDASRQLELAQEQRDEIARCGSWRGRRRWQCQDAGVVLADCTITQVQGDDQEWWIHVCCDLGERVTLARAAQHAAGLEQRRIGEALHESLGQDLAAAALLLRGLSRELQPQLSSRLADIDGILSQCIEQCRRMAQGMAPFMLGRHGLAVALRELARQTAERSPLQVRVVVSQDVQGAADEVAAALYQTVDRVLTDIAQRSPGACVDVRVWRDADRLVATLTDDVPSVLHGNAIERALDADSAIAALGGQIEAVRSGTRGRRIIVQMPMQPARLSSPIENDFPGLAGCHGLEALQKVS